MVNAILISSILLFFLYALFEQFVIPKRKGNTLLTIHLKKGAKLDALIFILLIGIIFYQTRLHIASFTLFLLSFAIILSLYTAFFRSPLLLFKKTGLYLDNIFIDYKKVSAINLTENHIFVVDLTNGKRLTARLRNPQDQQTILQFLGYTPNAKEEKQCKESMY